MGLRVGRTFGPGAGLVAGRVAFAAAIIGLASGGCATPRAEYTPEAIRREVLRRTTGVESEQVVIPFEVSPAFVVRARELLRGHSDGETRTRLLVAALSAPDGFGLRYAWAETATGDEALRRGFGNCFALSSALVGLARGVGLKAFYVEVVVAEPEWRRQGDLSIQADHIGAVIVTRSGRSFVDFSGRLARGHSVRPISDLEALAHYYNNIGYEILYRAERDGEPTPWAEASRDFAVATEIDPGLARAWNNLGVARFRQGDSAGAEAAYLMALHHRPDVQSAHLNLAALYLRTGASEEAAKHLQAAERLDPRNPQLRRLQGRVEDDPLVTDPALGG